MVTGFDIESDESAGAGESVVGELIGSQRGAKEAGVIEDVRDRA
jgi:hypothetical protein